MTTRPTHVRSRIALATGALAALGAALVAPSTVHAGRCRHGNNAPRTPIALTLSLGANLADFGSTPSACPSNSLQLDLRGTVLYDPAAPDFYGRVVAETVLSGTTKLSESSWLSASLTVFQYAIVRNATVGTTAQSFGPATIGLHRTLFTGNGWLVSGFIRFLLPIDTSQNYGLPPTGFEPGLVALLAPSNHSTITAGLSFPLTVVFGPNLTRFTPRLSLDAAARPFHGFEAALGVEARLGTDDAGPLEYVAPKLALRAFPGHAVVQLSAMLPVVGTAAESLDGNQTRLGMNARVSLAVGTYW